jgi:hypothetical protein
MEQIYLCKTKLRQKKKVYPPGGKVGRFKKEYYPGVPDTSSSYWDLYRRKCLVLNDWVGFH